MRYTDSLAVASCLILANVLPASTPPFSTFLQENASIVSVGHDTAGNLYALGTRANGSHFVTQMNGSGGRVAYSIDLSGTGCDGGNAMAVDGAGNMYIAGRSSAVYDGSYPCVLKLNSSGNVVYSFVVESAAKAEAYAIALDADGSVLITGHASQVGFPSVGGGFSAPGSSVANFVTSQPFIARIDPAGAKLVASAVGVGGSQIAIGPGGDIFVAGNAAGFGIGDRPVVSYPITPGAFQITFTPSFDCTFLCQMSFPSAEQYVTRLPSTLTSLVYSTFVTGSRGASNRALAVDSAGNAYLTGTTNSTDYPYFGVEAGTPRPGLFLTKLDPSGGRLVWSVRQGGDLLAFDADGNLLAGGSVYPPGGLPYQQGTTYPPLPPTGDIPEACLPNGVRVQVAAAVQRLSAQDGRALATQLLSTTRAQPSAMDVLPDGRILVAGYSAFPDIPLTPGAVFTSAVAQRTLSGAFLAAFDLASASLGGKLACAVDGLTNLPLAPVAPGQLITLFGSGLGPADAASASPYGPDPVPTTLGGVSVTFDGFAAPLTYASSAQINAVVPWEVRGRTFTVMSVAVDGAVVATREFVVVASNPALFVDTGGTAADGNSSFPAVALNSDGSRNSRANPAAAGSWVSLFLNGVGAYPGGATPSNGSITGWDAAPLGVPVTVTLGTITLETGPLMPQAGAVAGLSQVRVRLPGSSGGDLRVLPLTVTVDDVPAAPFASYGKVFQAGGWIWVN
ncbi:MAG: SBBP repeat-containing protein [Acidobacteria bacterium]|nr:SBBP repeat-containing protein [Acidobacteriota bacterium]